MTITAARLSAGGGALPVIMSIITALLTAACLKLSWFTVKSFAIVTWKPCNQPDRTSSSNAVRSAAAAAAAAAGSRGAPTHYASATAIDAHSHNGVKAHMSLL